MIALRAGVSADLRNARRGATVLRYEHPGDHQSPRDRTPGRSGACDPPSPNLSRRCSTIGLSDEAAGVKSEEHETTSGERSVTLAAVPPGTRRRGPLDSRSRSGHDLDGRRVPGDL